MQTFVRVREILATHKDVVRTASLRGSAGAAEETGLADNAALSLRIHREMYG